MRRIASSSSGGARRLSLLGGTGALAAMALASAGGCEDAYELPCRGSTTRVLVADPQIGVHPLVALARSRDRATAWWSRQEIVLGDGGGSVATTFAGFEVAVVDEAGALGLRASVPAPEELRARRAGIARVGLTVEDGAFLVYWIETTATSEADGRIRTDAALKAAYVRDGVASPAQAPPRASCEACTMAVASAALGGESLVFVRIDADATRGPVAPTFVALRFREGAAIVDAAVPWLTTSPSLARGGGLVGAPATESRPAEVGGALSAYVDQGGRLAIATRDRAWLADDALRLLAGPIELPSAPDVRVSWDARGGASAAWSVSLVVDGRATAELPREVFTGLVPPGGSLVAGRERTSRGRTTLALDRRGDEVGVLFESAARTLFATVDPAGRKRGGDVIVGAAHTGGPHEYGSPNVPIGHALFARGGGRFDVLTLGLGELSVSEIACAP
ncbi:MAG: hypothetical protein KF894_12140 [Labilithrix sp.]|nr:hypothetical protein [Labilithrix sp.]